MRSVLLAPQRGERVLGEARREQHLDELLRELLAERRLDLRLRTTTPPYAEVGSEASALSYASSIVSADRDAARVRVLDDHARRQRELARERARRREVVEVVEGELLPVQLLDPREEVAARAALGVVRGALVRVLAVARSSTLSSETTSESGNSSRALNHVAIAAS